MRSFSVIHWMLCLTLSSSLGLIGCASQSAMNSSTETSDDAAASTIAINTDQFTSDATMLAHYTHNPIKLDGKLTEPIWQTATAYPLHAIRKRTVPDFELQEPAVIRLAWDETHFYVAGQFHDADVIDNNKSDQRFLYSFGDTMELFLKPGTRKWYWEFYGTPNNYKTTLFYPSRGRFGLNPFPFQASSGLKVASAVDGTINNLHDEDKGYVVEMAIPLKDLNLEGQGMFAKDVQWSILVSRYNFSAKSETFQAELSTTPKLKRVNFHLYETWAKLKLVK